MMHCYGSNCKEHFKVCVYDEDVETDKTKINVTLNNFNETQNKKYVQFKDSTIRNTIIVNSYTGSGKSECIKKIKDEYKYAVFIST